MDSDQWLAFAARVLPQTRFVWLLLKAKTFALYHCFALQDLWIGNQEVVTANTAVSLTVIMFWCPIGVTSIS